MVRSYGNKATSVHQGLLNLLFPPSCEVCDRDLTDTSQVCAGCVEKLARLPEASCRRCGAMISPSHARGDRCDDCRDPALRFSRLVCLGEYQGQLRDVVLRMKCPSQTALTLAMGRLLWRDRREILEEIRPDLLIPIPMHWTRRLRRGVNSPELLAEPIARALSAPVARGVLGLRRNPLVQSSLTPSRRFENMRGAFRCSAGYDIRGARVLLIDDVLTTGATCSEAAAQLRRHGAKDVFVAVVSRTIRT